jgi:hypothetical protein
MPRWRPDGKELFYISPDQKLMAIPVKAGVAFEGGTPAALFDTAMRLGPGGATRNLYQPAADGQRFLMNLPPEGAKAPPITVVINWQAGLKK